MKGNEDIKKELKKLAPTLAEWKDHDIPAPELPAGYFDALPGDVIRRAKAEEGLFPEAVQPSTATGTVSGQFWKWLERIPLRLALGAVVILFIGIWGFWSVQSNAGGNATFAGSLDELEQADINKYIANHINEFDMALLMEAGLADQNTMDGMLMDELSDEDLDEYLEEIIEGLDLEDLHDIL
jgi:hypothetical protein